MMFTLCCIYNVIDLFPDVDECAGEGGGHTCDPNAECIDTVASYDCACSTGYTGDGIRPTCVGMYLTIKQPKR